MDFQNRQYDPQIGRFLSIDPLADDGQEEWSPYAAMGNNPAMMVDPLGLKNYMHDYHSTTTASPVYGGAGRREYNPGRNADEFNELNAALAMGAHDLKIRSQFYEISGMFKGVGTGLVAGNDLRGGAHHGFTEDQVNDAGWIIDKTGDDRYFAHRWVTDKGDIRTLRRETAQFIRSPAEIEVDMRTRAKALSNSNLQDALGTTLDVAGMSLDIIEKGFTEANAVRASDQFARGAETVGRISQGANYLNTGLILLKGQQNDWRLSDKIDLGANAVGYFGTYGKVFAISWFFTDKMSQTLENRSLSEHFEAYFEKRTLLKGIEQNRKDLGIDNW